MGSGRPTAIGRRPCPALTLTFGPDRLNAMHSITFAPIARADFSLLSCWLSTAHVARWWNDDPSVAAIEDDYGCCVDGSEPAEVFIFRCEGAPVGLIQRYRFGAYPHYVDALAHILAVPSDFSSIDYLIGETNALGKGIGTAMIAAFTARTWEDDRDTPGIIVPVQADNRASWSALERAGFERIGEGELEPDNPIDRWSHYIYKLVRVEQD